MIAAAFYKFVALPDFADLKAPLLAFCEERGVKGTILLAAHRAIESITLDREVAHLKDQLMPRYAELIYYGFWFAPERRMLQAAIDASQEHVTGRVKLKLYKGNVMVSGRESPHSLYSMKYVTFEDGKLVICGDAERPKVFDEESTLTFTHQ